MTCVSKEYEIKNINGTGAMTTAKMTFLLDYNLKFFFSGGFDFWWGGNKNLIGGVCVLGGGGISPVGGRGGVSKFLPGRGGGLSTGEGTPSIPPSRENPCIRTYRTGSAAMRNG